MCVLWLRTYRCFLKKLINADVLLPIKGEILLHKVAELVVLLENAHNKIDFANKIEI